MTQTAKPESLNTRIYQALVARETASAREIAESVGLDARITAAHLAVMASGRHKSYSDVRRIARGIYSITPAEPIPPSPPDLDALRIIARDPSGTAVAQDALGRLWTVQPFIQSNHDPERST